MPTLMLNISLIRAVDRRASALAAVALALGLMAQAALAGPRPGDGLALYLAAILLFVLARPNSWPIQKHMASKADVPIRAYVPLVWLIGISLGLTVSALVAFELPGLAGWAWLFHFLSIGFLLLALWPVRPQIPLRALLQVARRSQWKTCLALALLLMLAFIPRAWNAEAIPEGVWFDEARVGVAAHNIQTDSAYRPVYIPYIERPAHHAYLVALSFAILGTSVAAMRLVPELFGVLNVLMAALLFGRWLNKGLAGALVAGGLMACMRYELTFARIAFDVNTTPFFIMLVLYFLDCGLHSRVPFEFALAGVALGVGLAFYLPMRLFAAELAALALLSALLLWRRHRTWRALQPLLFSGLAFIIGAAIALAPVAEYAVVNPSIFFERNATASIFYQPEEPDIRLALWNNVVRYAGMFNYTGDRNGHHNLPGAPMLDAVSGVLFLFGLGLALRAWRRPANTFMLLTFGAMLLAGIFSADSEAPQSLRVIGVIPCIIYFAAIALFSAVDAFFGAARQPARWPRPATIVMVGTLLLIAALNLDTYFNRQAKDPVVWASHSIEETWIGREMQRLTSSDDVVLTWRYWNSPTIKFFAPDSNLAQMWTVQDHLPPNLPPARRMVMFLDPTVSGTVVEAARLYPNATVRTLTSPGSAVPLAYELIVPPGLP